MTEGRCMTCKKQVEIQDGEEVVMKNGMKAHACSDRNILLTVISNLYLAALTDGQMRVLHDLAQIMAVLSQMDINEFPYPLGQASTTGSLNTTKS
mgnify:CR=1 FL=1